MRVCLLAFGPTVHLLPPGFDASRRWGGAGFFSQMEGDPPGVRDLKLFASYLEELLLTSSVILASSGQHSFRHEKVEC